MADYGKSKEKTEMYSNNNSHLMIDLTVDSSERCALLTLRNEWMRC